MIIYLILLLLIHINSFMFITNDSDNENNCLHSDEHVHERDDSSYNETQPILPITTTVNTVNTASTAIKHKPNLLHIQLCVASLTCLSTCLDGYLLIFIGYNNSILNRKWNLSATHMLLLEIIYHFTGALGGILSIPTCYFSNQIGMNFNFIFALSTIPSIFILFHTDSYITYIISISHICLSNGHLYNIGTNLIINKFSTHTRGSIFALIYFFNQFGKLIFSVFIFNYSAVLQSGNITLTIHPILFIMFLQIIINMFLLNTYNNNDGSPSYNVLTRIYNTFAQLKFTKNKADTFDLYRYLIQPICNIFIESPPMHGVLLVIMNISLGIQFFAMVNVFPLLKKPIPAFLTNEIFFSKITHTILLGVFTLVFIVYSLNAKACLLVAFVVNLILNLSIMFDWFNSYWIIHLFRFVWNISYVMNSLYCAEAILKKNRGTNTSFLYMMFKVSCVCEILTVNRVIMVSLFLPIAINVFVLLFDVVVVRKLKVETYMKTCKEIDNEIKELTGE